LLNDCAGVSSFEEKSCGMPLRPSFSGPSVSARLTAAGGARALIVVRTSTIAARCLFTSGARVFVVSSQSRKACFGTAFPAALR
jgi:hypothetical protein